MRRALCVAILAATGWVGLALGDGVRPRSPVVYPAHGTTLVMDHGTPAHRALACTNCHAAALKSARASDDLRPTEANCLPCHADRVDRSQITRDRCGFCHRGFDPERSGSVPTSPARTAHLKFSHRSHAARGVACRQCHRGVDGGKTGDALLPSMQQCTACHEKPETNACESCHDAHPSGRLRTRFAEGRLSPGAALAAMSHDADWVVRHRWVAADSGQTCEACHAERDCTRCHDGRTPPRSVHPNDFLTLHAQQARRDAPRCSSCHSTERFCTECHARLGVSGLSAPDLRAGGRFHPPAARWIRGPVEHAREARRSLNACVSCHAERDCVQCHAPGLGPAVSPHPVGFRSRCDALLRANPRACRTCHGDLNGLSGACK